MPPVGTKDSLDPTKFSYPPIVETSLITINGAHWYIETNRTSGEVRFTFDDPQLVYQ